MRIKSNFEIVKIADDYTLVPVADRIESFNGIVILNDVSAFLLENMQEDKSEKELVQLLIDEFDVDKKTAEGDIHEMLIEMKRIGIIHE